MKLDEILFGSCRPDYIAFIKAAHKAQFTQAHRASAAMKHDIEANRVLRVVALWHDQAIRVCGTVDGGNIAADQATFLIRPGCVSRSKCLGSLPAPLKRLLNQPDVGRGEFRV